MSKSNWKRIQEVIPGTKFNYDFWTLCEPKRSTYPSCRAVICAKNQNPDDRAINDSMQYSKPIT